MFSGLFDKVPAKRAGLESDIVGTVLYLVSMAGVRSARKRNADIGLCQWKVIVCRWRESSGS